jgi:ABC-type transport system involved in multi-copper enzyme maturation permease subunit
MLYKEWILVRKKFIFLMAIYDLAALVIATMFAPKYYDQNPVKPFYSWLLMALAITLAAAVLGGADSFAEETDKGTMGFLLTHPVGRAKIYLTKLALNCGTFIVALLTSSLVMFLVDQVPRNHVVYTYTYNNCGISDSQISGSAPNPITSLPDAFTGVASNLLIGITLLCLTMLISIYARTTVNAIMFTLFAILVLALSIILLNGNFSRSSIDFTTVGSFQLVPYFLPLLVILFVAGLVSFKHREF